MRGDVDNRIKQLLDACQAGGAITNDRLCQRLVVERDADRECNAYLTLRPIK
jgi:Holliday junction resolvase RusA-like endonuclease